MRSSSHDRITVPSRQERKTSVTLSVSSAVSSSSQPSAYACMMAYSMPLWTILEKCPAPTFPACTAPKSPSGLRVSKAACTLAMSAASPPYIRA